MQVQLNSHSATDQAASLPQPPFVQRQVFSEYRRSRPRTTRCFSEAAAVVRIYQDVALQGVR